MQKISDEQINKKQQHIDTNHKVVEKLDKIEEQLKNKELQIKR